MKSNRFRAVQYFASVGSTNDVAATLPHGSVVVADQQTAGRGRRGHGWFSPPGSGLYVSVVLAPATARADPARATMLLTLAAGVAIAEGVERAAGLTVDLKWPNDLMVAGRKLGGILAEGSGDTVVLGYGINVLETAFPPELANRATSLESALGRVVTREAALARRSPRCRSAYDDSLAGRFDAILDARAIARRRQRRTRDLTAGGVTPSGVTEGSTTAARCWCAQAIALERIVSGKFRGYNRVVALCASVPTSPCF